MRIVISFLAGVIVAIGLSGRAVEIFVEDGQCRFGLERDGTFYNADLRHHNYMTPGCASFGFADKFKESRIGWRIALIESGAIQARDNVARVVDGSQETGKPCDPDANGNWLGCHAVFNGRGKMYGFSLGLTYEQPLALGFSAVGEGGLLIFRSVFRSNIVPLDYKKPDGETPETSGVQDSGWLSAPAPYMGLMLKYGRAYAGLRYYWPSGHRALSLTNHSFTQASAGVVAWKF